MRENRVFWRRRSCCHFHGDPLDTSEYCRVLFLYLSCDAFHWRGLTQSPEERIIDDLLDGLTGRPELGECRRMNRASRCVGAFYGEDHPSNLGTRAAGPSLLSAPRSATSYSVSARCFSVKMLSKLQGSHDLGFASISFLKHY